MKPIHIDFKEGGDNPSEFEIEKYRQSIQNKTYLHISSTLALDIIRVEMVKGNILIEGSTMDIYSGEKIIKCKWIKSGITPQWVDLEYDETKPCNNLSLHMPETKELSARMDLMLDMI